MKYSITDLLSTTLVPELATKVPTRSAYHTHLGLVGVSALRAAPVQFGIFVFVYFDFAIESADLTIVGLGIQFSIHDILIDILHNGQYSIQIVLHIGNFYIANSATRRKLLEFRFEL